MLFTLFTLHQRYLAHVSEFRDFLWLQNSEQLKQEKGQNVWVGHGSSQEQLSKENTSVMG